MPVEPGWNVRITASGGGPPVGTTCALWVEAGRAVLPSAATVECPGDVDLFFGVVQDDQYETGPCQLLTEPEVILTCAAGSETIDTEAGTARLTDEQGRLYELEILERIDD